MAEDLTLPQLMCVRTRFTALDDEGAMTGTPYVTAALISLKATPNVTEGDKIEEKSAAGSVCASYQAPNTTNWYDVELQVCTPDPRLRAMLTGGTVLSDPPRSGYAAPALGAVDIATAPAISIEAWALRVNSGSPDTDSPYAWIALPKVTSIVDTGGLELSNTAQKPTFSAKAYENSAWGSVDYPVAYDRVWQWIACTAADVPTATV